MLDSLRKILSALDVLADELRAVTRRAVATDAAATAGPPAMVRQLESRVLLSVSPAAAGDASSTGGSTMPVAGELGAMGGSDALEDTDAQLTQDNAASDGQSAMRRELLFIDSKLDDDQQLLSDLSDDRSDRWLSVVVLDGDRDGIEQITVALQEYAELDAIHFVTHGTEGAVKLGSTWLRADSLDAYAGDIAGWAQSLSDGADMLFYGCDVAGSAAGRTLIASLATLTGADVAASTDNTGHADFAGDWDLEYLAGNIETAVVIPPQTQAEWRALLDAFTVTNTNDTGAGSLRRAILDANALPGADTISFNIAGAGPHTINVLSELPSITDAVSLDGTTQPGYAGAPIIELNGSVAGGSADGLHVSAGGTTIRGLVINRFSHDGIELDGGSGNTIQGNYLGTNLAGSAARGNGLDGIRINNSANNVIGGLTPAERNIISGNDIHGVRVIGGSADNNMILGNYIGLNAAGTAAVGNSFNGIFIDSGADDNIVGGTAVGAGNVVSGNLDTGVEIQDGNSTGNRIEGNIIGLDAAGTAAIGNPDGVIIEDAPNNTVGGPTTAHRNIISGNTGGSRGSGVIIFGTNATGNLVQGNFIGTDITGMLDRGNDADGVLISDHGDGGVFKGAASGNTVRDNVLSGNDYSGVSISNSGVNNNLILGNYIGVDASGTGALGNSVFGVVIWNGANGNQIGDITPGAGNLIAHNNCGVLVDSNATASRNNSIRGNSIHTNAGLGIDLNNDGVTANDLGDSDLGPNRLRNYPVLTDATVFGTDLTVAGTLNTRPFLNHQVDFYWSPVGDASGHGEGQTYIGSVNGTSDSIGNVSFNITFVGVSVPVGAAITATTTDASGNTSEFSLSQTAVGGNDAPLLNPATSPVLATENEDAGVPVGAVGTLVSALVDFAIPAGQVDNVTDPDAGALLGIAVTAADTTNGTWWYSTNHGSTWNPLGAVSDTNARLLAANAGTRLYFGPHVNWNGTLANAITFRAWDQTTGSNGTLTDTSTNGGMTAYSSTTDTTSLVVNGVNDAPIITSDGGGPTAAVCAAENSAAVSSVTAADPEAPPQTLTYSIVGGADAAKFSIHNSTGVLTFVSPPDYANPTDGGLDNVYNVTVQVSDGAGGNDAQAIAVTVTDVNESGVTAISDADATADFVLENAANGTVVGVTAFAADADGTDTVSYALDTNAGGRFAIHAVTGVVTVSGALDRETAGGYDITVRATSSDTTSTTRTFAITIGDVDEFDIGVVVDSAAAVNTVVENAANGTVVGVTVLASDADATNNAITYSLDDDAGGRFAIHATTGVVTVNGVLDYETAVNHVITVRAISSDGSFATWSFAIAVSSDIVPPPPPVPGNVLPSENTRTSGDSSEDLTSDSPDDGGGADNLLVPEAAPRLPNRTWASTDGVEGQADLSPSSDADTEREPAQALFLAQARGNTTFGTLRQSHSETDSNAVSPATDEDSGGGQTAGVESRTFTHLGQSGKLWRDLDEFHATLESDLELSTIAIGSVGTIASGFTVGYVLWVLRSGLLLSSVLAALPVWTMFDPLMVVSASGPRDDGQDEDSLEEIVENQATWTATRPPQDSHTEPLP